MHKMCSESFSLNEEIDFTNGNGLTESGRADKV